MVCPYINIDCGAIDFSKYFQHILASSGKSDPSVLENDPKKYGQGQKLTTNEKSTIFELSS